MQTVFVSKCLKLKGDLLDSSKREIGLEATKRQFQQGGNQRNVEWVCRHDFIKKKLNKLIDFDVEKF